MAGTVIIQRPAIQGTSMAPASIAPRPVLTDPGIERARAIWTAGEFGRIAVGYAQGAAEFVTRLALRPGETVLDVACGTGNLSLPAARAGARVTGLDVAPNLIDAARQAAAEASLDVQFDVGASETLPYADGSFHTVISMFGVMFSAHPAETLAELFRVTRPGGRIVVANWSRDSFVGDMLRAHTSLVPPPAGAPDTLAWGDEPALRARLAAHASRIRSIAFAPRTITFTYPMTPAATVELFRAYYGPSVRTFAALDAPGRATLSEKLLRLWTTENRAVDGTTNVDSQYLETAIAVA